MSIRTRNPLDLLALAACMCMSTAAATSSRADIYPVNSVGDRPDANLNDGDCDTGFTVVFGMFGVAECTLRAALQQGNFTAGADQVTFFSGIALGGLGVATIAPASPLPVITDEISIDGTTHSAFDTNDPYAQPVIYLDGASAAGNAGLDFSTGASDSSVHGMGIIRFHNGIDIGTAADNVLVEGSWLGILNGMPAAGNNRGILVQGDTAVVGKQCSGSSCVGRGNVASGNSFIGIQLLGDGALVAGNRVGTDGDGLVAVPNVSSGVTADGQFNQIGFPISAPLPSSGGNLVSGNGTYGIHLSGMDNRAEGNIVGLNASGTLPLPNGIGVFVTGERERVGSASLASGNVIAGNTNDQAESEGSTVVVFEGNYFGLGPDGAQVFANPSSLYAGLQLTDADRNTVRSNHFGGAHYGVRFSGGEGHTLDGNWIGVNNAGQDLMIEQKGIFISLSNNSNIGSPGMSPNVIGRTGVAIEVHDSTGHRIRNNDLGRIPSGASAPIDYGLVLYFTNDTVVGADNGVPGSAMQPTENRIEASLVGVYLLNHNSIRNPIRGNRMEVTSGVPIDLFNGIGLIPNDPEDLDGGSNEQMNHPEIDPSSVVWNHTNGTLDLSYRADSPYALQPLVVDFYVDDGPGSESVWFGTDIISGEAVDEYDSVSIVPPPGITVNGRTIYATATDGSAGGNTSFYSPPISVPEPGTTMGLLFGAAMVGSLNRRRRARVGADPG